MVLIEKTKQTVDSKVTFCKLQKCAEDIGKLEGQILPTLPKPGDWTKGKNELLFIGQDRTE